MVRILYHLIRKDYKVEQIVNRIASIDHKLETEYDPYQRMILTKERETLINSLIKIYRR